MNISFCEAIRATLPPEKAMNALQRPPLALAYIGDTVYDLYIRTRLALRHDASVHILHTLASKLVCAKGQAAALKRVTPHLNEEEMDVCRRGRNAKVGTVPKNAELRDYLAATGFEALLGYLFLSGQDGRLMEILRLSLDQDI